MAPGIRKRLLTRVMSFLQLGSPLPSLANNLLLIGHEEKADVVWTRAQFMVLCEHLLNGNRRNDFLMAFPRPEGDPRDPYAKSKTQRMERRAAWAWDHITGKANSPAGIGFYPNNAEGKSRWGAMDFDSHDGNTERARSLALNAFQLLLRHPELFLILSTSGGGGWHLFALTATFHPVDKWAQLFRQVASFIGTPVEKGILEIFPNDGRGLGNAIRAPGTWHPKRDSFSLILYENTTPLLASRCMEERDSPFLHQSTLREKTLQLTEQGDNRCEATLRKFTICQNSTRHTQLTALVSELYRFYSRPVVEALAGRQFEAKTVETRATKEIHLAEFASLWVYWLGRYRIALSAAERTKEAMLVTDNEKEAFRLAWGFAHIDPAKDFAYSTGHFARNLGISLPGAAKQRQKFCELEILKQTAAFIANVRAARFLWTAAEGA